jgi:hypothetical protein
LLKLPDDSLTKEIKLTQDLMTLFIKYQIPSDLLSYDGGMFESVEYKLQRVKECVASMINFVSVDATKCKQEQQDTLVEKLRKENPTLKYTN